MSSGAASEPRKTLRMMILDDEPIVCKRLKPTFQKMGYIVETFTDSSQAMERLQSSHFDVVITDLKMEGADGIQVLATAKSASEETQVIIITGFATSDTAKESYAKGAVEFIAKPFKIGDIVACVQRLEKQRHGRSSSAASPTA
jgi:DNA-binding NtrC family response regulator